MQPFFVTHRITTRFHNEIIITKLNFPSMLVKINGNESVVERKIAFLTYNRDVDFKAVLSYKESIEKNGFLNTESLKFITTERSKDENIVIIEKVTTKTTTNKKNKTEVTGLEITSREFNPEKDSDAIIILDGQHRTLAYMLLENTDKKYIPTAVEMDNDIDLAEYLKIVNTTRKDWTKADFVKGIAMKSKSKELLDIITLAEKHIVNDEVALTLCSLASQSTSKGSIINMFDSDSASLEKYIKEKLCVTKRSVTIGTDFINLIVANCQKLKDKTRFSRAFKSVYSTLVAEEGEEYAIKYFKWLLSNDSNKDVRIELEKIKGANTAANEDEYKKHLSIRLSAFVKESEKEPSLQ